MHISILHSVVGALRTVVYDQVRGSGCEIATDPEGASFVIGLVNSSWPDIPGNQKIILLDPGKVETLPQEAITFNYFTLLTTEGQPKTLLHFLKEKLIEHTEV
jgi:hypothetical protein